MTLIEFYWPVFAAGLVIALAVGRVYFNPNKRKGS